MKNFNFNTIKEITDKAFPRKLTHNLRKATRQYKIIQKIIYFSAKHGRYYADIKKIRLKPEVVAWLKQEGFKVEYIEPFHDRIRWN